MTSLIRDLQGFGVFKASGGGGGRADSRLYGPRAKILLLSPRCPGRGAPRVQEMPRVWASSTGVVGRASGDFRVLAEILNHRHIRRNIIEPELRDHKPSEPTQKAQGQQAEKLWFMIFWLMTATQQPYALKLHLDDFSFLVIRWLPSQRNYVGRATTSD